MKKNILSKLNFSLDLVNEFSKYSKKLEDYFSKPGNITNHLDLYLYFKDLRDNVTLLSDKYGIDK